MSDDDGIQAWAPIEVVEGLLKRAEQAEAAIQRASDDFDNVAAYCAGYVDALRRVRRALDGGAE